jgi:hypothetical protein
MRQFSIAATAAILLTAAPHLRAADGPYLAAGYAVTGFETLCGGDACDRHDGGFRAAAGWGFAKYLTVEALYLRAGHFVADNVTAGGDVFTQVYADFELKLDPAGNPWLIMAPPDYTAPLTAQRFNAANSSWDLIGGPLPDDGVRLNLPQLRFDSASNPVLAGIIQTNVSGSATFGTVVYRFDGTTWSTRGAHQVAQGASADFSLGLALLNGQTYVSWINTAATDSESTAVVQRTAGTNWTSVGAGDGEIPQYTVRNNTPFSTSASTVIHSTTPMAVVGTDFYMVVVAWPVSTLYGPAPTVTLLKVAD